MNDLAIIIVSWNCKGYLADCLRSIYADGSEFSRAIIVVDNNSNDGTLEMLREDFPQPRICGGLQSGNEIFAESFRVAAEP
jgi:GT2 family glycosyltransferase